MFFVCPSGIRCSARFCFIRFFHFFFSLISTIVRDSDGIRVFSATKLFCCENNKKKRWISLLIGLMTFAIKKKPLTLSILFLKVLGSVDSLKMCAIDEKKVNWMVNQLINAWVLAYSVTFIEVIDRYSSNLIWIWFLLRFASKCSLPKYLWWSTI